MKIESISDILTPEKLAEDGTGKALTVATFHKIHRGHVLGFANYVLRVPGQPTDAQRQEYTEAVLAFATLGWAAFHVMNHGQPFKEAPSPKTAKKPASRKPKKKRKGKT